MSEKRRDNRNRILRSGESQRKDGRYAYKYTDTFGKVQFVYAWKLVPTDKTPAGKRDDISLREKEKEIQKDLDDGIDTIGKKMTVCELYAKQNRHRGNVRHNTTKGRERLMKLLEADKLGSCPIDSVKLSDAKEWALRMKEKGISYKTISNDKRSLKAAFYTAIQDDCIRKNPFDFQLNTVIEDDTEPKVPLTGEQEESLLSFMQSDSVYQKYRDEVIILLGTGLRISQLHTVNGAGTKFIRFQQLHQPFAPLCGVMLYVPPVAVLLVSAGEGSVRPCRERFITRLNKRLFFAVEYSAASSINSFENPVSAVRNPVCTRNLPLSVSTFICCLHF